MHDAVRSRVDARASRATPCCCRPACASFDWYASYAARGDDFAARGRARSSEVRAMTTATRLARGTSARRRSRRQRPPTPSTCRARRTTCCSSRRSRVLNVVGVVMVLSASSVVVARRATDRRGTSSMRQLVWTLLGVVAFVVVVADRLPPLAPRSSAARSSSRGVLLVARARPGVGIVRRRVAPLARRRRVALPAERARQARARCCSRPTC